MTSKGGTGKPGPNSRAFHIWGSDQTKLRAYREQEREGNESRNDPTRPRRSNEAEAHKAKLERDIQDGLNKRHTMTPIRKADQRDDEAEAA